MKTGYRVIRFIDGKTNQPFYALAKVVFDDEGKPDGCMEPILDADTLQELLDEFEEVKKAFIVKSIEEKDFFNVH